MDNKAHMVFHDQDIRQETEKETTDKVLALVKYVAKLRNNNYSDGQIAGELKDKYDLDNQLIQKLLS